MKLLPDKSKKVIPPKSPKGKGLMPGRGLLKQAFIAIIVFLFLVSLYSMFFNVSGSKQEVSLSTLAQDISLGTVSSIKVVGDNLEIAYTNGQEKFLRKKLVRL